MDWSCKRLSQSVQVGAVIAIFAAQSTFGDIWYVDERRDYCVLSDGSHCCDFQGNPCVSEGEGTVDRPYCKIGYAIQRAQCGDSILVYPSSGDLGYIEPDVGCCNLDLEGKQLTIKSVCGAEATVISPKLSGRSLFVVDGQAGIGTLIEGFTLRGVNGAGTSAISCTAGAAPTIRGNIFRGNQSNAGAAIFCQGSSPTITQNRFESNFALTGLIGRGGAIYCDESSGPEISYCVFIGNRARSGGAIGAAGSSVQRIRHSVFLDNHAEFNGGAVLIAQTAPFSPSEGDDPCITATRLVRIENCLFARNLAGTNGFTWAYGGACFFGGTIVLAVENCTFAENRVSFMSAQNGGGAITTQNSCGVFRNTIFWHNSSNGGLGNQLTISGNNGVGYCDVGIDDDHESIDWTGLFTYGNNIVADPLFVDPGGQTGTWEDDYHLSEGSPCIDGGTNSAASASSAYDAEGYMRICVANGTVDIGAYEYQGAPELSLAGEGSRYLNSRPQLTPGFPLAIRVWGDPFNAYVSCLSLETGTAPYVGSDGLLGAQPWCKEAGDAPGAWSTAHIRGFGIRPKTKYFARIEYGTAAGACAITAPGCSVASTTWRWGDSNNDGDVDLDDLLCVYGRFGGSCTAACAPNLANCLYAVDVLGASCAPNAFVNLDDILGFHGAFEGKCMAQAGGCAAGDPCAEPAVTCP